MAGDKPKDPFAALPTRALWDSELTALELRVLGCVCWHDRLSKQKASAGCYAANRTMAAEVGCTITSLSRALSRLAKRGYIERDYRGVPGKRHLTVYRVLYDASDVETIAQRGKDYLPEEADDICPDGQKSFARADHKNGRNPLLVGAQETSLREEINSSEDEEINSSEEARFSARSLSRLEFADNPGGQLASFEREWKASPQRFSVDTLEQWATYCEEVQEIVERGGPEFGQAQRLADEIELALDELRNGRPMPEWAKV